LRTTQALAGRGREQGELFDQMLRTIDEERASLAMRLHDGPQQTMTAVRLMCDVIGDSVRTGDVARATEVLDRLEHVASAAADDLRRTVARLHPVVMEQQGLIQALGSLAETVQEEYGVDATFTRPSSTWDADNDRDTAIFQIAREAATNAARHGRPPVTISLEREEGRIYLSIEDTGGMLPTATGGGIGLRMMRERASRIGAAITLDANPGRWSAVRLELPVLNGTPAR
jgi:two-component system sensor histidine kinase UhpB